MANNESRGTWSTNIGFILAAVGSAIGLGNVWRFSFLCHKHGGGAFLIPYFTALLIVGIPLMLLEYGLGHRERAASALAFRRHGKAWEIGGWWMPTAAMFGIMIWYAVVMAWCVSYFFFSFNLSWGDNPQAFFLTDYLGVMNPNVETDVMTSFMQASDAPIRLGALQWKIVIPTVFVWILCWFVCFRDVAHGIERACLIFMPLLFVLTIILVAWSFTLDGATEAIFSHYLHVDLARINPFTSDPEAQKAALSAWRDAFGQIFFTLSLGFGIMVAYSSYLPRKSDMITNALATCAINCGYSFVAGFIVFGVVGFMAQAQSVPFEDAITTGPPLAFIVYPKAISLLPAFQSAFGVMFFLVLVLAGVSSGISLVEAFACNVTDKFGWRREWVVTGVCVVGLLGSIVFCTQGGLPLLDITNHYVDNALLIGGLMECVLVGWVIRSVVMRKHLSDSSGWNLPALWDFLIRFAAPLGVAVIFGYGIYTEFLGNYEGYKTSALVTIGFVAMIGIFVASLVLTWFKWSPERLKREHEVGEDELFT